MNKDRAANSANKTEAMDSVTSTNVASVEANRIHASKTPLSQAEKKLLADYEKTIGEGLKTFRQVGSALLQVRDQRLYREQYDTFEEYCREKWQFSSRQAYHLIDASIVVQNLECEQMFTKEPLAIPATEGAARPLANLSKQEQVAAARIVGKNPGKPTGKDFQKAADDMSGKLKQATEEDDEDKPRVRAYMPEPEGDGDTEAPNQDLEKLLELIDHAQTQARSTTGCEDVAKELGGLAKIVTRRLNGGAK